jgi:hypothetical protein
MKEDGYKYILTYQDNLSKYLIAIPTLTQTAKVTTFLRHIVLLYGIPQFIVTGQGSQFMSDVCKILCKLLKLNKLNTTAYCPESNGALERIHMTKEEYFGCFCNPRGNDLDKWLLFACFVYNTTHHDQVYKIRNIIWKKSQVLYLYIIDLIHDIKKKLKECHEIARSNLIQSRKELKIERIKFTCHYFVNEIFF